MNNTIIVHMTRSSAKCPICGKTFYHEPEHAYKIGHTNSKGGKLVCSYTCMRKWEKDNHIKRRGDSK
jgi:hypothetical protein